MSLSIYSKDFFEKIALSKADKNSNGKIDSPEEKSIFEAELLKFDMNGDGKFNGKDVKLYKYQMAACTSEDEKELNNLADEYTELENEYNNLSDTDTVRKAYNLTKRQEIRQKFDQLYPLIKSKTQFINDVLATIQYLLGQKDKNANEYYNSFTNELSSQSEQQ